ncbi:MAG TPA: S-layer homology domain-containing protein, partial [Tissierellaceae bacterium]|nr:S-layer homology domain-containing protein [Tissierellaceae bacterium]
GEDLIVTGYEDVYDGAAHSITVAGLINGDKAFYKAVDGEWTETNPGYTNVGTYSVEVRVTNPNYADRFGSATVKITPTALTVTANSKTEEYTGSDITVEGYVVEGLLDGDVLSGITASRTEKNVGDYPVTFTGTPIINDAAGVDVTENYAIRLVDGNLKITEKKKDPSRPYRPSRPSRPSEEIVEIDVDEIPLGSIEDKLNMEDHLQYIKGYPNNTVQPEGLITREEVATVFFRLLTSKYRESIRTTSHDFLDVQAGRWSEKHIATLAKGKIVEGYKADGTFKPGNNITRAELATIASRFDNLKPFTSNKFSDIDGHWANEYINSASEKGWVKGYEDGTFKPDQYITRAEFVTLVNNVLNRHVKKEEILKDAKQFPDLDKGKWYYEAMQEAINSHHYTREEDQKYEVWTKIYYPKLEM